MAIDNAEKRRSAAVVGAFWLGPGVTSNLAKDTEWRQQVAWAYSGFISFVAVASLVCGSISIFPLLNGTPELLECEE